jgi:hypothetical protein
MLKFGAIVDFSENWLNFTDDLIEATVAYKPIGGGQWQMVVNDWVYAITCSKSSRFTSVPVPYNGIRVTN